MNPLCDFSKVRQLLLRWCAVLNTSLAMKIWDSRYMPEIFSDFFVICTALVGTMIAAVMGVLGPISAAVNGAAGAVVACLPKPPAPNLGAIGGLVKSSSMHQVSSSLMEQVWHFSSLPLNLKHDPLTCYDLHSGLLWGRCKSI